MGRIKSKIYPKKDNKVLFIDALREFERLGNKNVLSEKNINKIFEIYKQRKKEKYFSKLVDNSTIAENDYNLAVSNYVEQGDTKNKY